MKRGSVALKAFVFLALDVFWCGEAYAASFGASKERLTRELESPKVDRSLKPAYSKIGYHGVIWKLRR